MARLFATLMSAVTILALGIVALQYRVNSLEGAGLSGDNQEAFDLVTNVSGDALAITGNALPRLLMVVLLVFIVVLLLIIR